MDKFIASAASRETSSEIMEAIASIAHGDVNDAVRIWEAPSDAELLAVWETVTLYGLLDADTYCWGEAGYRWADKILYTITPARALN